LNQLQQLKYWTIGKMRSSRISKDSSKLFDRITESTSPPRRVTRSALAKFAFVSPEESKPVLGDIEDIGGPARKRRRVTTKTKVSTSPQAVKSELVDEALDDIPSPPTKARRVRKPARKAVDATTGATKIEPPSDWEAIYDTVRKMRAPGGRAYGAAVDTMGCERLADQSASPKDQRFHTLVALMLSSQTKDTVNAVVMRKMQTELPPFEPGAPPGLNLNNILAIDPKLLNEFIWAVGFHNNKTKFVLPDRCAWTDRDLADMVLGISSKRLRYSAINGTATSLTRSKASYRYRAWGPRWHSSACQWPGAKL
jgi:endonuclease-3